MNTDDFKSKLVTACKFPEIWEDRDGNMRPKTEFCYFRFDYDGYRWWNTIQYIHDELGTSPLVDELNSVAEAFRKTFPTLGDMTEYCESHAERISEREYNCFLELEHGYYWLRMITTFRDYNLYLHCYSKEASTRLIKEKG